MALNLNALRVFAAVAEHGGFSRAAAVLRVSQPAVSRAVRALEDQVGLPLLERGARAARLTEAGAALHARARELFAVERVAEEELGALRGLGRGTLRVGASTTIATYLLPPLLGRFRARHPGISLHVTSANTRAIARLLLQRRLDVALVEGPVSHPRLVVRPWRVDELVVIAPAGHPLARARGVRAARLADEPLIVREKGSGTRVVAEAALAGRGVSPRVVMRLGSTEAIKQAVAAGLGLAIVSREAAADQIALGQVAVVAVTDLAMRRPLSRLGVAERAPGAAAAAFEAMLDAPGDDGPGDDGAGDDGAGDDGAGDDGAARGRRARPTVARGARR